MTDNTSSSPAPHDPATTPADHAATTPRPQAPTADHAAPVEKTARPAKRRWLIGAGAAVAAVVLVGGGVAVGAAIADEDDDRDDIALSSADRPAGDDPDGDRSANGSDGSAAASVTGAASADELVAIAEAARAEADGDVVSIDAERDGGWDVQLETAAGDETEVRIAVDDTAMITSTDTADGDDTGPTHVLDAATIDALVTAALADTEGTIVELSADDRDDRPYDVTVLTNDRRTVELDLDASFAVVATDLDDESDDD